MPEQLELMEILQDLKPENLIWKEQREETQQLVAETFAALMVKFLAAAADDSKEGQCDE